MTKPFALLVAVLMVNGCASSSREVSDAAVSPVAVAPTPATAPVATPAPVPAPEVVPPKAAGEPAKASPPPTPALTPPPKAAPPVKTAAATPAPPPAPAKPSPAVAPAPATLDLKSLESRLKGSSAIGVMTKLSLKNQVDDLVKRFRAYHDGSRPPQLAELRPSYELLLMKVLSLLQDKDTALAKDINASREAIWGLLADREKLSRFA